MEPSNRLTARHQLGGVLLDQIMKWGGVRRGQKLTGFIPPCQKENKTNVGKQMLFLSTILKVDFSPPYAVPATMCQAVSQQSKTWMKKQPKKKFKGASSKPEQQLLKTTLKVTRKLSYKKKPEGWLKNLHTLKKKTKMRCVVGLCPVLTGFYGSSWDGLSGRQNRWRTTGWKGKERSK